MPAPKGNKYAIGNEGGRPLKLEDPEHLERLCNEYFDHTDSSPWLKNEAIKSGDMAGTFFQVPTQRPYTLIAMCHYIGICTNTWRDYCKREEFSSLTTRIREKIDNHKYEGAVVGAFNPNIIARDLGLSEKHQHGGDPDNDAPITISFKGLKQKSKDGDSL